MDEFDPQGVATALVLPLRDAARGVRSVVHASADALHPTAAVLPPPVRNLIKDALQHADDVREHTPFRKHPEAAEIEAAAVAIRDGGLPLAATGPMAVVLGYGIQVALRRSEGPRLLVRETVLALAATDALRRTESAATESERAAVIAAQLTRAPIAGPPPLRGLLSAPTDEERIARAVIAAVVWLLAERPDDPQDEEKLLSLAIALVGKAGDDAIANINDTQALSDALNSLQGLL
ncbi:MAG: hypothetical protein AAGJ94_12180 [Pseudomonadota bacterium]